MFTFCSDIIKCSGLILTQCRCVNNGEKAEVDCHEKVGGREVADEELWHVHFGLSEHADEEDAAVA